VLAQALLFGCVSGILALHPLDATSPLFDAVPILIGANLLLMLLNILPYPRLDGWKAWRLFRWRNLRSIGRRGILRARESRCAPSSLGSNARSAIGTRTG
jgi:Zn-dependent protease